MLIRSPPNSGSTAYPIRSRKGDGEVKKAGSIRSTSVSSRVHIVLVPGFAGFDALGQLEYYAGVTPQFRRWKKASGTDRQNVVLHYFDNFPTAAVVTRAARLRDYLAKRVARGEFLPGDSLALVGHSTGGLDIRRLIWDLDTELKKNADARFPVDGTHGSPFTVPAAELLRKVNRIVFLSVPQFGTNIADWVRTYALGRQAVVAELRASVAASQVPLLDRLQDWISSLAAKGSNLDLLKAVQRCFVRSRASQGPGPYAGCAGPGSCIRVGAVAASYCLGLRRHRRPYRRRLRRQENQSLAFQDGDTRAGDRSLEASPHPYTGPTPVSALVRSSLMRINPRRGGIC